MGKSFELLEDELRDEVKEHLTGVIIPFWKKLRDDEFGGFYGYMDYDLVLDKKYVKGCILNSRITWFFSRAYLLLKDESLLEYAKHGFEFMKKYCYDTENGGIFWSMNYDGTPDDTTKHTYNQAFAIYALSCYYEATKDAEALNMAISIFEVIEKYCTDEIGYKEAFDIHFNEVSNEKLSENGVMAEKTMNTWLHILEAYTELYKVSGDERVKNRLKVVINTFVNKIFNPKLNRLEVFFDRNMNTIIDLHSYGHDIEASWLLDRAIDVLSGEAVISGALMDKISAETLCDLEGIDKAEVNRVTEVLRKQILSVAFNGESLANECERGVVNTHRIWWVQAENVVGFFNGWKKSAREEYYETVLANWRFIKDKMVDHRAGSEWFWEIQEDGTPFEGRPIVEPWKCPYHNGRMCLELMQRI